MSPVPPITGACFWGSPALRKSQHIEKLPSSTGAAPSDVCTAPKRNARKGYTEAGPAECQRTDSQVTHTHTLFFRSIAENGKSVTRRFENRFVGRGCLDRNERVRSPGQQSPRINYPGRGGRRWEAAALVKGLIALPVPACYPRRLPTPQ